MNSKIMAFRQERAGTLKDATARLIEAVGGLKSAAELSRVGVSQLHAYAAEDQPTTYMPVDIARALEAASGQPSITHCLAAAGGYTLHRQDNGDGAIHTTIKEVGDVLSTLGQALADGQIDRDEASALIREIDEAMTQMTGLRLRLVPVVEGRNLKAV